MTHVVSVCGADAVGDQHTIKAHGGEAPSRSQDLDRPTILVVEDEFLVRMAIAEKLREAGYGVIEAINADEALVVLRSGTKVTVVFSDVRLPGSMDGIGLAQLVRMELPSIKIILASGDHPALNLASHDGFFSKPYGAEGVIALIRNLTR
jgi:two-component system, response regulator PdtaR